MSQSGVFFLGVDGGGSGCRARLTDANGAILGRGCSGPATLRLGGEAAWASLMTAAVAAVEEAGLVGSEHQVHAAIGVAGIGRAGAREALCAKSSAFASLVIDSDAAIACLGAHGGGDGGIVVAGTGSIGFGYAGGREVRVGGYGFPCSDEGSGADLGLEAVRLALRAHDGRIAATPLLFQLMQNFGDDPYEVVAWMDRAGATDYANLAPLVADYAASGDAAARFLMGQAGISLAVIAQTLLKAGVSRLSLMGGLSTTIEAWLPPDVRRHFVKPADDALGGAIILARRMATRLVVH